MSAPLTRFASTTSVPRDIPATMRLRIGNDCLSALRLNGNCVRTAPWAAMRSNNSTFSGGKTMLMKVPVYRTTEPVVDSTADGMKTAYSYTRFSTVEQRKGASAGRQMDSAIEWCKSNGYTLSEDHFLDEGKSAYKGKHLQADGDLKRFLALVETGKVRRGSALVLESFDR